MINAHGGLKKWKAAETFSFQNIMFNSSLQGLPFWINEVAVDQKTRSRFPQLQVVNYREGSSPPSQIHLCRITPFMVILT